MSTPNRCYESITKLRIGEWNIRIWRTEPQQNAVNNSDIVEWAEGLVSMIVQTDLDVNRGFLLKRASEFDGVSAVEVTDDDGMGCLVYPDWK